MRLSRFNVWVKDYPERGKYLVYNTRTQALIKLDEAFKRQLEYEIHSVSESAMNELQESGIVVKDRLEEEEKLNDFFNQLIFEHNGLAFEVTILTTYSCNFGCDYCFEESVKVDVFLDKETANLIAQWLIKTAKDKDFRRIYIVYYGGEPLMNVGPIYDISWLVKQWAEKENIDFGFGIITNGSLLSKELVEKLKTVGLNQVRITLDGDRDSHNARRPFEDGRPSFDLIIGKIKELIDIVDLGVAGNFDRSNFKGILRLLDFLEQEGLLRKSSKIDFAPLAPRLGPKERPGKIELSECLSYSR